MKKLTFLFILGILLINVATSQLSYDNPNLPRVELLNIIYFTDLDDTPNNYAGSEGYCVAVNSAGTGLQFQNCTNATINLANGTFIRTDGTSTCTAEIPFAKNISTDEINPYTDNSAIFMRELLLDFAGKDRILHLIGTTSGPSIHASTTGSEILRIDIDSTAHTSGGNGKDLYGLIIDGESGGEDIHRALLIDGDDFISAIQVESGTSTFNAAVLLNEYVWIGDYAFAIYNDAPYLTFEDISGGQSAKFVMDALFTRDINVSQDFNMDSYGDDGYTMNFGRAKEGYIGQSDGGPLLMSTRATSGNAAAEILIRGGTSTGNNGTNVTIEGGGTQLDSVKTGGWAKLLGGEGSDGKDGVNAGSGGDAIVEGGASGDLTGAGSAGKGGNVRLLGGEGVDGGTNGTVKVGYESQAPTQALDRDDLFVGNSLEVAGFSWFGNNITAPNICYSDGTNCTTLDNLTNVAFLNNTQTFTGVNTFTDNITYNTDGNDYIYFGDSTDYAGFSSNGLFTVGSTDDKARIRMCNDIGCRIFTELPAGQLQIFDVIPAAGSDIAYFRTTTLDANKNMTICGYKSGIGAEQRCLTTMLGASDTEWEFRNDIGTINEWVFKDADLHAEEDIITDGSYYAGSDEGLTTTLNMSTCNMTFTGGILTSFEGCA